MTSHQDPRGEWGELAYSDAGGANVVGGELPDDVVRQLHDWLHGLAAEWLRGKDVVTLQATALVNDAFVKLIRSGTLSGSRSRSFVMAACARALREVIIDYTRRHYAQKRWNGRRPTVLDRIDAEARRRGIDLLELNDALDVLARSRPRQARIVELRFFGGFTMREIANSLGISLSTTESQWSAARKWLENRLGPGSQTP